MRNQVKSDIIKLLVNIISQHQGKKRYIFIIRKGRLYEQFKNKYPLYYQRDNRYLLNLKSFSEIISELNICSNYKKNGKKRKKYRILKRRLSEWI